VAEGISQQPYAQEENKMSEDEDKKAVERNLKLVELIKLKTKIEADMRDLRERIDTYVKINHVEDAKRLGAKFAKADESRDNIINSIKTIEARIAGSKESKDADEKIDDLDDRLDKLMKMSQDNTQGINQIKDQLDSMQREDSSEGT